MLHCEIEQAIDSAHFLKLTYPSKCTSHHGHRWEFKVFIAAEKPNENGMVIDFTVVKDIIKEMDHVTLNKLDAFKNVNPTAENICIMLSREVQDKCDLETSKPVCYRIELKETPTSKVVWERDT